MMKSSSPVDSDVAFLAVESGSPFHTATCTDATELKQAVEHRAIIANVEFRLLALVTVHVFGANLLQEVYVVVGVKLGHLEVRRGLGSLGVESSRVSITAQSHMVW